MAFPTTNLEAHYEAKDESAYSDGNEATTVTDQSGNGRDLTGLGLTWETNELNGHAVYRFDGQDDEAVLSVTISPSVWSMAVLCASASEATSRIFPFSFNTGTSSIAGFTEGDTASEWGIFFRTSAGTQDGIATSGVDTTVWTLLVIVWDGATVSFYRDNTLVSDASLAGTIAFDRINLAGFLSQFFGDVALAAGWSKALTSTERTDLQDYVDSTYFAAAFDPANLAASVLGSDVTLTWDV